MRLRGYISALLLIVLVSISACAQYGTSKLYNRSGTTVSKFDVVIWDTSNNLSFKTTTTARDPKVIGVVNDASISNNTTGQIVQPGAIIKVRVTGAVTRGDYLVTSTTAGAAASGGTTNASGAFAVALESGTSTNINAYLITAGFSTAGALVPSSLQLEDNNFLIFGTDSDFKWTYDETTDDRLELSDGTNLMAYFTDAGTEANFGVTGDTYVQDDDFLILGTDSDMRFSYDETTDDRLEITDAAGNVMAWVKDGGSTGVLAADTLEVQNIRDVGEVSAAIEFYGAATGYVAFNGRIAGSASTTTRATVTIPHGVAPSVPNNGDVWTTTAGLYAQINGSTVGPYVSSAGVGDSVSVGGSGATDANFIDGNGIDVSLNTTPTPDEITVALAALTADWDQTGAFDISLNNASSELKILESAGATYFGIFDVTDLGADRTYTFPNVSGTVVTTGDTGSVTSAMVASDLANADIAAGAAIAETKLALARVYWLSAGAVWPAASGGCSTPALDANNNVACAFAASTTGYMSVPVPSNYDGSTENVAVYWYKATDTNSVTWTIESVVIADNGDETATTATGTITNTAAPASATNVQIDSPSSTTFFGGSGNAGLWARIKITTNAYSGGTASLLGIKVEY